MCFANPLEYGRHGSDFVCLKPQKRKEDVYRRQAEHALPHSQSRKHGGNGRFGYVYMRRPVKLMPLFLSRHALSGKGHMD